MDQGRQNYYRTLLEAEKLKILRTLPRNGLTVVESELVNQETMDKGEQSEINARTAVNVKVISDKTKTLQKILWALTKISKGKYGDCFACGRPIEEKRLAAVPYESRCKKCQEEVEQKVKLMARNPPLGGFLRGPGEEEE